MRKKTVSHIADTIFWYVLYFLPVIIFLLQLLSPVPLEGQTIDFVQFILANPCFSYGTFITNTLEQIFGWSGVMPLICSSLLCVFSWYVTVYIIHLAVDFLLFIPRLCHKFMKDYTEGL